MRTNATGLTSNPTTLWVPYKGSKEQNVYAITYTVEGIKENVLVVRSAIKKSDGQILDDKPIEMRLPSDVGRPATYSPRLKGMEASTVTFQLVLLERLSPTELILATGINLPQLLELESYTLLAIRPTVLSLFSTRFYQNVGEVAVSLYNKTGLGEERINIDAFDSCSLKLPPHVSIWPHRPVKRIAFLPCLKAEVPSGCCPRSMLPSRSRWPRRRSRRRWFPSVSW